MKKLFLFLLCVFVVVFFASTNVLAYSYTKADIPEYSLYFAEPGDTEHSITAIDDLVIGDNFVFDVWISDVPTGKQGLEACYFDIQYDPQAMTYHEDQGLTMVMNTNLRVGIRMVLWHGNGRSHQELMVTFPCCNLLFSARGLELQP